MLLELELPRLLAPGEQRWQVGEDDRKEKERELKMRRDNERLKKLGMRR